MLHISDRTHHIYETVRNYHLDKWELTTLVLGPSTNQARAVRLVESGVIREVRAYCNIQPKLMETMVACNFVLSPGGINTNEVRSGFAVWVRGKTWTYE